MAFDGISTKNILIELNKNLINARVEKIYVPTKNDIFFNFHTQNRENLKLLISIDANNARIHFSNTTKENPVKAPQICMILRKHLQGAKLLSISQQGLDRIIIFTFQNLNEMGDLVERKLIVELMGKYSNVILTNEDNKIIDSMRHVDTTMSSVREVLPNKDYIIPTTLGKVNFEGLSFEEFKENILKQEEALTLPNKIINTFIGFGKSFATYIVESLNINFNSINEDDLEKVYDKLVFIFNILKNDSLCFTLNSNDKDYILDDSCVCTENLCLSKFLDEFYIKKESVSIIKNAKMNIEHEVKSHLSKLNKKLAVVSETLEKSEDFEKYKQYGELLNCYMHKLTTGTDKIEVENFYDNNNQVEIPLQKNLSPSKNAQNYFKKYNKAKSSIAHASKYKKEYEDDIKYLNSVIAELELAENLNEIDDIREELILEGYIKKTYKGNKKKDLPSEPIKYEFNNVEILVGRNNIQNDRLTFKIAKKSYMWLHTKNIHGSHVIIKSENISDELLYEAAKLAVKHSQGKNSSKVEVDYTLVKYVHKEVGAKPGMVVYTDYHTIIV